MTKQEFSQFISSRFIYLDGATGSNLVKAGMPAGVCPEAWILDNRKVMLDLQKAYVQAGTNILYAPTFSGNRIKLRQYGLENKTEQILTDLVSITSEAAGRQGNAPGHGDIRDRILVAGDLTMTGEQLTPMGKLELEELIDIYKEQIIYMVNAGVDLLVVETMMSLQETRAAIIAAKEVCHLPIMATVTFEKDGRTLYGTDATTAAAVLESLGVCAVGVNCSTGPAHMEPLIRAMSKAVNIPVIAKPNAGLPSLDASGITCYDMDADTFAEEMCSLVHAGALFLGGCCGTTPEYIYKLHKKVDQLQYPGIKGRAEELRLLCSERRTVAFTLEQNLMIVGERINPTGKKKLQAKLREGDLDEVVRLAEEQEQCGAQILDVNMGMSGIDEMDMMLKSVREISQTSVLPLSLDSSHIEVLEAALRHYPGRALVNSVSLEKEKFDRLLPVVAKYGAMFILLPLSDSGLPRDLGEKKQIIHRIMERALALGMRKEDIVVDGLVTTVGANKAAALETLETIRYCKSLGLATICGLSNISFGLPQRSFINTAFLTMAIQAGLTMAIANPSQELLMGCAMAADLLLNKEASDLHYIAYANTLGQDAGTAPLRKSATDIQNRNTTLTDKDTVAAALTGYRKELYDAVLKGNRRGIASITERALADGETASTLLNEALLPAINMVGDYFDRGQYFLPQLISGAEAMKLAIEVLEPLLLEDTESKDMPVVVIATVQGDIHDIGKNLVALMLKNHGFQVIDLGKDVPAADIIRAAEEHNADIIALSALMTTTMQRMGEVVQLAGKKGLRAKIMIGGAVITSEYAREIGADGYSGDAASAVRLARKLTGLEDGI